MFSAGTDRSGRLRPRPRWRRAGGARRGHGQRGGSGPAAGGAPREPRQLRRAPPALQRGVPAAVGGGEADRHQDPEQPLPGDTHGAHEHPGPLRVPLQCHLRGGPAAQPHRGLPHPGRGHGQRREPQRAGPAAAGGAAAAQSRVPEPPGQVRDVAVRRRVPRRGLHGHAHPGQPRPAGRLRDRGGPFPAERHGPPGAGRGAGVPPAARRGGGHPDAGRQVHGPQVGDDAERGLRGRPRQLLPPGQRAGAGGGGAGGQHAAAGDHLHLRVPAQPAPRQRRLQRAPGQQLERGGGAGEEAAPPARHPGPGRLPEPLEEPLPLRLQRHRGLRARGARGAHPAQGAAGPGPGGAAGPPGPGDNA